MIRRRKPPCMVIAMACVLAPAVSHALLEDCDISATSVAFGSYDPLGASPTDGAGTISMKCTVTLVAVLVHWDIRLSTGSSGSFAGRSMVKGGSNLMYNLYTNAGRSTVWGDGTSGTSYASATSLLVVGNSTINYTVYGRIPVSQDRAAGAYADTIVVTLDY